MRQLTSNDRKYLRSLAHHLKPVVYVGKQGVTDNLVAATDEALEALELVKVKFNEFKDEKGRLADEIETRTGAALVDIIGNVAILYREQEDEEKRRITLPA